MEEAGADLMRRATLAFGARDVEAMKEVLHPEAEFHSLFALTDGGAYRGHEDVARYLGDLDGAFENWHIEDVEILTGPGGQVVATYRAVGSGAGSGFPIDARVALRWEVRDGLLWRGHGYMDVDAALADAGIEPPDPG